MKNSAAGEMNTQVEGGEEYKLLSSLKLSLDFDISAGEISMLSFPEAIHLEMEIRIDGIIQCWELPIRKQNGCV